MPPQDTVYATVLYVSLAVLAGSVLSSVFGNGGVLREFANTMKSGIRAVFWD